MPGNRICKQRGALVLGLMYECIVVCVQVYDLSSKVVGRISHACRAVM
jgi:hypothetical protein